MSSKTSRPTLESTQPPIQGLFGKIYPRVKLPDSEAYPVSWLIMYGAKPLLPPILCSVCTNAFMFNKKQKPAKIAPCDKFTLYIWSRRCRWPRGLRWRSPATRLLGLRVRIPPGSWVPVSCEGCVLWDKVLRDRPITRPEESCRLWCVCVCQNLNEKA